MSAASACGLATDFIVIGPENVRTITSPMPNCRSSAPAVCVFTDWTECSGASWRLS